MLRYLQAGAQRSGVRHIAFTKKKLNAILGVYSSQVIKGLWRDYALDFLKSMAVFSIFRSSHEQPIATIVKLPANTATGYVFEIFFEKKRLSRTAKLDDALNHLRQKLRDGSVK